MQKVTFQIPDGMLAYGGVAITRALNTETGEHTLHISEFGDQTRSSIIGVIQTALDRQRELMKQTWDGQG